MARLSKEQQASLMEAAKRYHSSLGGSPAEEYLAGRGLLEHAKQYGLGFVKDPVQGHDAFQGMLSIPYLRQTAYGKWTAVTIRFRCLDPTCKHEKWKHPGGKYSPIPGHGGQLFNTVQILRNHDRIAITEGELDAITATEAGVPCVSVQGVKSWKSHYTPLFLGYESVLVLADNDDNGEGMEFGSMLAEKLPNVRIIKMPRGHDVNSMVCEYGPEALLEKVRENDGAE